MLSLISLPYAADALAPAVSAQTLSFHHGKHLKAYVDNANALLPGTGLEEAPLEEVVIRSAGALRLNAGQVLNHNLYFTSLRAPREDNRPAGALLAAIEAHFGSFDAFWEAFVSAATRVEARSCRMSITAKATDAVMTSRLQSKNSFLLSPPAVGNLLFSMMPCSLPHPETALCRFPAGCCPITPVKEHPQIL